jgi:hydrogenase maturation protease
MAEKVPSPQTRQTLIVGVGNEFRGDDGVGIYIARKLQKMKLADVLVIEQSGEGTSLLESFKDRENVIIIDASQSGAQPGTIHSFEVSNQPLPKDMQFRSYSSHAFGVVEAIELARALGQMPQKLTVYGIEAKAFDPGENLSDEVKDAAEQLIIQLLKELKSNQNYRQ